MNGRFEYIRADDVATAVALVSADPAAHYLAGGTTQVDLLLKDGVLNPDRLVDITRLPLRGTSRRGDVLVVGALTTMEELAADPDLGERAGFVRTALLAGASPQLRNMRAGSEHVDGQRDVVGRARSGDRDVVACRDSDPGERRAELARADEIGRAHV